MLVIGLIMCLMGVIMISIGAFTGGMKFVTANEETREKLSGFNHFSMDKTQIEEFKSINGDFAVCDLTVKESKDDKFYLEYQVANAVKKDPMEFYIKNGVFHINDLKNRSYKKVNVDLLNIVVEAFKGMKEGEYDVDNLGKVILYVPDGKQLKNKGLKGKINLEIGNLSINNVNLENMDLDVSTGAIKITQSHIKNSNIENNTGDINLNQCTLSAVEISGETGDFKGKGIQVDKSSSIELVTGDISINLNDKSRTEVDINTSSQTGDVYMDIQGNLKNPKTAIDNPKLGRQVKLRLETETGDISVS